MMRSRFSIAILCLLFFSQCDYISESGYRQAVVVDTTNSRKVFLEEFTGHTCGECPPAAVIARELKDIYGDRLVFMSIHAGAFADPKGSATPYTYDFRDSGATKLYNHFLVTNNPIGMVNREGFPSRIHLLNPLAWGTAVDSAMKYQNYAFLKISPSYNPDSRTIETDVKVTFENDLNARLKLAVYLVEDSIVKPQKDYDVPSQVIIDYVHRHVFRKSLTEPLGESLSSQSSYSTEDVFIRSFVYTIPAEYDVKHCSLIAVLMNRDTEEVIQVEEKHIQ